MSAAGGILQPPNARRCRPNMPSYGVLPAETAGMLNWDWVETRMKAARNYWVCTVKADGSPHTVPVWGVWLAGEFSFGSGPKSTKTLNIARDARVSIHLESGDDVVIFEGELRQTAPGPELARQLTAEYRRKYQLDPQLADTDSVFFRLLPRKVMAWRESDFPATATYWLFDERALN